MGQGYKTFLTSCPFPTGKDKLKVLVFTVAVLQIMSLDIQWLTHFRGKESGAVSGFKTLG